MNSDELFLEARYVLCHPHMLVTQANLREIIEAQLTELLKLRGAIRITIEENGHLADGENCTLSHLKKAIGDE